MSACSQSFFDKIGVNPKCVKRPSIQLIRGAGGAVHKITAEAILEIQIEDLRIRHKFFVVPDLNHACILGFDFLTEYEVQISYENNTVTINDRQAQAKINLITNCNKARLTRAHFIPPGTIRTVQVQMPGRRLREGKIVMLSPSSQLAELQISLIECLVPSDKDKAWIQIANFQRTAVRLKKRTPIADMHILESDEIQNLPNERKPQINHMQQKVDVDGTPKLTTTRAQSQNLDFDLSNSDLNEQQKQELLNLLHEYRDCFANSMEEIGCTHLISHSIDTTDDIPVKARPYKTSPEMKKVLESEVQKLLDNDIIEYSSSDYASPVFLVRKPNNTFRLVVDFRKLNQKIKDVVFPLPLLNDVVDQIGTNKSAYFSVADLKSGYFQVPLEKDCRHRSAFICHHGLFQFKRMVMGLSTSSSTFQKLMNNVFKGLSWHILLCYLDDVLVHSQTFEEHLAHLRLVFDSLRAANLTLTPSKCSFATKHVKFLGNYLSKEGVRPCKSNTHAIDSFPRPKTQKQVRHFLGMSGFYRRYIKDYTRIAFPLFKLLTKQGSDCRGTISWNEDCERAFGDLKRALTTEPVLLKYPNPDKPYCLHTDGSKKGVSYVLSQEDEEGILHPICYGGKSLRPDQTNWPISHIELYAIVLGIREYRTYLTSRKFRIMTDCKCLTWLKTTKHTNGRLIRWNLELMQYNFDISHLEGKKNVVADCLSRREYKDTHEQQEQNTTDDLDRQTHINYTPQESDISDYAETRTTKTNQVQNNDQKVPQSSEDIKQAFINALKSGANPSEAKIDVSKLQKECEEIKPMYMYLKYEQLPKNAQIARQLIIESQQYAMLNDRLYHLYQSRAKRKDPQARLEHQLVVPKCLRPDVLHAFHDSATGACHPGFKRTFESIRGRYFWKHMYQESYDYVTSCKICQEMKRDTNRRNAPLKPYDVDPIFSRWHLDFLSGLPETKNGNKHILLAIDSFSHMTKAFAMKTQSANEVAKIVYESIICRYGTPEVIVTDNAANFCSKILNTLCDMFHIKKQTISSYAPHSNGIIERQNSILTQGLRALCSETPNKWDEHLQSVMMAFRMSPSLQSTGYSPFISRQVDKCTYQ